MLKKFFSIAAVAMLFAACEIVEVEVEPVIGQGSGVYTIGATFEDSLTKSDVNDKGEFTWSGADSAPKDEIWVYSDTKLWNPFVRNNGQSDSNTCQFSCSAFQGNYMNKAAVFPKIERYDSNWDLLYSNEPVFDGETLYINLPGEIQWENASKNNYTSSSGFQCDYLTMQADNVMVAFFSNYGSNYIDNLQFYNAGGLFRLMLNNVPAGAASLEFFSADNKKIRGRFEVATSGTNPIIPTINTVAIAATATGEELNENKVTINFDAVNNTTNRVFFIPVPVGEYRIGLDIKDANGNSLWTYTSTKKNSVTRGMMKKMPVLTCNVQTGGSGEGTQSNTIVTSANTDSSSSVTSVNLPNTTSDVFVRMNQNVGTINIAYSENAEHPANVYLTALDDIAALNVELPDSHVELSGDGNKMETIDQINANTAVNTLVVFGNVQIGKSGTNDGLKVTGGSLELNAPVAGTVTVDIPATNTNASEEEKVNVEINSAITNLVITSAATQKDPDKVWVSINEGASVAETITVPEVNCNLYIANGASATTVTTSAEENTISGTVGTLSASTSAQTGAETPTVTVTSDAKVSTSISATGGADIYIEDGANTTAASQSTDDGKGSSITTFGNTHVARIGSTGYTTLAAAITAAAAGDEIVILKNMTVTEGYNITKNLTINLSGKTITVKATSDDDSHFNTNRLFFVQGASVDDKVDFTLKNGTTVLDSHIWGSVRFNSHGELTLIDYTSSNCREYGANIKMSYGHATFTNVVINADKGGCVDIGDGANDNSPSGAVAEMTNCTFNQTNEGSTADYKTVSAAIITSYSGHVILNSGSYSGYYGLFPHTSGGTIIVKDGCTVTGRCNAVHTRSHNHTATQEDHCIYIQGGTINGTFNVATDGHTTFSITGGTFDHDPSAYVAPGYATTKSGNLWTVVPAGVAAIGSTAYATLAEAIAAAQYGETVTLLKNITLSENLVIGGTYGDTPKVTTAIDPVNITLDLNGYNISGDKTIYLAGGSLNITGTGTIETTGSGVAAVGIRYVKTDGYSVLDYESKRTLTVGQNVTLRGPYGINVFGTNEGTVANNIEVNVNGTIVGDVFVLGNLTNTANNININVNGTIDATTTSMNGIALNGYANVTVGENALVQGLSGIEVRAGRLTVNGGTVRGTSSPASVTSNGSGTTSQGFGIAVSQHGTKLPIEVVVTGGIVEGHTGLYVVNPENNSAADMEKVHVCISGGTFSAINAGVNAVAKSGSNIDSASLSITGGTYSSDPSAYCAAGYAAFEKTAGFWTVELLDASNAAAKIGSTYYATLVDAIEAVAENQTITIVNDIDFSRSAYVGYKWAGSTYNPLELCVNNVTVDLDGHTISNMGNCGIAIGHLLAKNGRVSNLTVKNGTLQAGKTDNVTNSYVLLIAGVDGMTVKNVTTNGGINVCSGSANVVIEDCTINGTKYYTVCSQTGSEVTIKGTTYTKNTDATVAEKSMFWIQGASTDSDMKTDLNPTGAFGASSITIENGSYTVDFSNDGKFYLTSGVAPSLKGGTYNFDPSAYCADGYEATKTSTTWTVAEIQGVAQIIGGERYNSLAEAIAAVPTDSEVTTIKMLANETMATGAQLSIAKTQNIVLDLNGKTVTGNGGLNGANFFFLTNRGTLEITDTSTGKNGKLTGYWTSPNTGYSNQFNTIYNLGGNLTLSDGTVETTTGYLSYAINNSSNAWGSGDDKETVFTMTGGTITAPSGDAALRVYQNCADSGNPLSHNTVNIKGGLIKDNGIFIDTYLYNANPATTSDHVYTNVTISGGEISGLIDLKMRHPYNTSVSVTGGTFRNSMFRVRKYVKEWNTNIPEPTTPVFTISGGDIQFANASDAFVVTKTVNENPANVWTSYSNQYSITGGSFNVDPSAYCAAGYVASGSGTTWTVAAAPTTWDGSSMAALTDLGNNTYGIYSAAQLAQLAYNVNNNDNNYAGKTVKLMNNIDLNNKAWTPIGLGGNSADDDKKSETGCFLGTFDGQDHTISNLTATHNNDDRSFAGLFGNITLYSAKSVVIKNVTVSNVNINSEHMAAGILARYYGNNSGASLTIDHCSVSGGTITSVPFTNGEIKESGNQAGGIVGNAYATGVNIKDCSVSGVTIQGTRDLGGIAGSMTDGAVVFSNNSVSNTTINQVFPVNIEPGKDMTTVHEIVGRVKAGWSVPFGNNASSVTINLQADKWDGITKVALSVKDGVYYIYTAAQLAQLAYDVNNNYNNYAGKTVKLMNNIDLNNKAWTPIGNNGSWNTAGTGFSGTFDGNCKTVSKLTVSELHGTTSFAGFFGIINPAKSSTVTIQNLTIDHFSVASNHQAGAILAHSGADAGVGKVVITGCTVSNGTLTSTPTQLPSGYDDANQVGAIAGALYNGAHEITSNSINSVTITGFRDLGGLVGFMTGSVLSNNTITGATINQVDAGYTVAEWKKTQTVNEYVGRRSNDESTCNTAWTLGEGNSFSGSINRLL